ncbi:sugar porter family MFS transporter [Flexithrix dorotheae]|uniref:sugar porter family MFS transporter n=1 Tax=Flexithrix dorotheae TaxID=70993 RepID=UPI000371D369|nr:sugar porter family MFS transporter [Flexithrix dorotheae]
MNKQFNYNQTYIWLICITAAMGGFLFGYDWVVIGGAKPFYEPYFNLTSATQKGWGTSSALVGCMAGALLCAFISDKLGRKRLLIASGLLFSLSALGTALADSFYMFNVYRIMGGVAMGISLNLSPMYISEISPPAKRGMFVTIMQLMVMFGVLLAQLINWQISLLDNSLPANASLEVIAQSWNGQKGWRWMFAAEFIPAILFFVLMYFVPESARWLIKNGQIEEAKKVFQKIGGTAYAEFELKDVGNTLSSENVARVNFKELLNPRILKVIGLGIFLAFLQQWSGINMVIYYAADIFQAAGYDLKEMMLNIVVIGSVMVLSVFITLFTVDKFGRKSLLLLGTSSMVIVYILIGLCFQLEANNGLTVVLLILINIMCYSITLAPLLWVVLSEIFPNRIRGAAMSIAALAHWIGNFSLTFTFPAINEAIGWANNFWMHGVICAIGFLILYKFLPETKGKTLEEIERELIGS